MEGPKVPSEARNDTEELGSDRLGRGIVAPPFMGVWAYAGRRIFKKSTLKSRIFLHFSSWNGLIISVGKARLGTILLLRFVLPPGTTGPQLRATRPPGVQDTERFQALFSAMRTLLEWGIAYPDFLAQRPTQLWEMRGTEKQ